MNKNWEVKKLEEVCQVVYGTRVVKKRDGGSKFPVYGGGGATFFMDNYNRENQIVIARFAMSEQCTRYVNGKFFLNDSGLTINSKNDQDLNQKFLDFQLLSLNDLIYSLGRGTAQKNLDVPAFKNINISYPASISEQQRIISILNETFAAIDKTKENAKKNLQSARELFESYLQSIFASPKDSWRRVRIEEICDSIIDCINKTAPIVNEPTPFKMIRTTNVRDGKIDLDSVNYVNEDVYKIWTRRQIPMIGDIILTREAPLGEVGMILTDDKIFLGQRLVSYRTNAAKLYNRFLLYAFQSGDLQGQIKALASGSTVQHMRVPDSKKLQIYLPSLPEQQSIVAKLDALSSETKRLEKIYQRKLAALDELKKSVLQKAFNGELTGA